MKTSEKVHYIFKKVNWGQSHLDAEAIGYMNEVLNEIEKLEEEGFISINCGDIIFRTDTMPIVILSMLNFSMRDIS